MRPDARDATELGTDSSAEAGPENIPEAIPPGTCFEGVLGFRGSARVEGRLRGSVVADGTLHVGLSARIEGRVEATEVVIAGSLDGEVCAARRIVLLSSAEVKGPLRAPRFSVAEGSVVQGQFITLAETPASRAEPSESRSESDGSGS